MLRRLLLATAGAATITIGMLLGMSGVVELFEQRDPTRYFSITDFIPAPPGRRRPDLVLPEAQPGRARVDTPTADRAVIDAPPDVEIGEPRVGPQDLHLDDPGPAVAGE
jgi:hypothetical protein